MALSTVQKDILNKLVDYLPALRKGQIASKDGGDILLGDVITDAASVSAAEIALANGKILVGGADALAHAQTMSGGATMTNAGVVTVVNTGVVAGKVTKTAAIPALGVTANLVGVDGTLNNAAPLVGTESRLDDLEAKVDLIIAALNA